MQKEWLIRTQQKQITGPLENSEVIKLIEEDLLSSDDELCTGNGFWIYIKEKDLLELFLYGDAEQVFNPVCEANSVLTEDKYTPLVVKRKKKKKSQVLNATPPKLSREPTEEELASFKSEAEEIFSYILDENLRTNYIQTYIDNRIKDLQ